MAHRLRSATAQGFERFSVRAALGRCGVENLIDAGYASKQLRDFAGRDISYDPAAAAILARQYRCAQRRNLSAIAVTEKDSARGPLQHVVPIVRA